MLDSAGDMLRKQRRINADESWISRRIVRDQPGERRGMPVKVEFYGIPRSRAGVSETMAEGGTVGEVLEDLARRLPQLAKSCIDGRHLKKGYTLNLGGERFVRDPDDRLSDGDVVLFMSLDAGG
jgi:molybdopterin converting factor small subunit